MTTTETDATPFDERAFYAREFPGRVDRTAAALRRLADDLEQGARDLEQRPAQRATSVASRLAHTWEWGLANASFSGIVSAADDYDRNVSDR